ncbi:hypothetical protein CFC21_062147 [Triticum aestivum]|uniref:DUF668 domain-containing protein n=3 Tax=Triticinae TaxID=1648030 RepID=A0A453IE67_AEGTS|nr:uncharacterized protein LOC109739470 [Aegilops tauschii subsp. strangulata]XP_044375710.1 uncharacterized protein LOC123097927 [Triticum aestivum]KAF7054482.1 hypothetical protein CFC21_062147 [Triticum aestivum]
MARSWLAGLRSRLGGGARQDGLGILAFEAAAAMSRLVSLHLSLSDAEVRRLRADVLRAEGVARLTSTDQSRLLRLACAELMAGLDRAADDAARLGARCRGLPDAPFLHDFDRVYADAKRGAGLARLDATVGFSRGAGKRFKKMERHVAATAKLYAEMDALTELEASERRMEQWKQHSGPIPVQSSKRQPADEPSEKLMGELRLQRQKVRRLTEGSLWSVAAHKVAKLMAKSVLAVLARVSLAFGALVPGLPPPLTGRGWALGHSSGPMHQSTAPDAAIRHSAPIFRQKDTASTSSEPLKPPATTVGGSGMELRYANVILSAETLLKALRPAIRNEEAHDGMTELAMRDELYKMLPVTIRAAVKEKLRERLRGGQVDEEAAATAMDAVDGVLRWLGPMAHDTLRWQDERSMERKQRFSMQPRAPMVQTLHFADRRKADAAIVEVLVGLSCMCWYDDQRRRPADWNE